MLGGRPLGGIVLLVALLVAQVPYPAAARADVVTRECFAATNLCIDEPFLTYWREHGGLAINGYPITEPFEQRLEDGLLHTVQYFERVRLESHPQNPEPYRELLGQFGRLLYATDPAMPLAAGVAPAPGAIYFTETRHNLAGRFLEYWRTNGGLEQFGYPISEELTETLEDGKTYTVQYFERARFEYHPENPAPYDVLLGQFGRRIVAALAPDVPLAIPRTPYFETLYRGDLGVRARLGQVSTPGTVELLTVLPFEHGAMFYRAATRTITVFAADANASRLQGYYRTYADTWEAGEEPGGGTVSQGLFNPQQGFGKVWREHTEVRQLLGYAIADTESTRLLFYLPFQGGLALDVNDASGDYRTGRGIFLFYANGRFEYRAPCTFLDCP